MCHRAFKRVLFALLLAPCFASCLMVEPMRQFVRDGGRSMYFVKPMDFSSRVRGERVTVDFTIHTTRDSLEDAVMNFSVFTAQPFRRVDSLRITSEGYTGSWVQGTEFLFVEPAPRGFHSRWSARFPKGELQALLASRKLRVEVRGAQRVEGETTRRARRALAKLRGQLLPLLFQAQP